MPMNLASLIAARSVLRIVLFAEGATAIAAILVPAYVARLLFGMGLFGAGIAAARLFGATLLALVIACWPGRDTGSVAPALRGMLIYSLLATLYLAYLGVGGELVGWLLWPAIVVHAVVTVILGRAWLTRTSTGR